MSRSIARVLALVLVLATSVVFAQTKRALTAADYDRATKMLPPALNGLVVGGAADATWLPDGRFSYVRTTLTGVSTRYMSPTRRSSCCCVAIFLPSGDHDNAGAALVVHPALLVA